MSMLLPLYHVLPAPLRSVAASLRGYYLRAWRYGATTDRLVAQAHEREALTAESWRAFQEERLFQVLHGAATRVPYYRAHWAERRRHGDRASIEVLENWPILDKEPLRAHPRAFLVEGMRPRRMFHEHTSGTTGKSLDLWLTRQTVQMAYALSEARVRNWHGVSRHDRWAILGGQVVTPVQTRRPPFWVWNAGLKQLYLSSYHLAPDLIPHYLDALSQHRITYLFVYPSALHALAQEALRLGRRDLHMKVVITNAEPLYDYQRQAISEAFHCPVRETYGMAELCVWASECQAGRLHLWPEVGRVEVCRDGAPVPDGEAGDLICTGLLNTDMPLVRYRVGDRGALGPSAAPCGCGRSLPVLSTIEGRADDVLYTRDGRAIGRLDPVFKARLPVREAQIIQESLDRVRVRYVPAEGFTPAAGQAMAARLRERLGAIDVVLEPLPELPLTANGKFRAVICNLPAEDRARISPNIPGPSGNAR